MSFVQRILKFRIALAHGEFDEGGDTVEIEGLRASVTIDKAGGGQMGRADIRIWGMPLSLMNQLTVLNILSMRERRNNTVTILAGDSDSGVGICYIGTIVQAWADASNAPDVLFHISAQVGFYDSTKPTPAISYAGSVDVTTILGTIASDLGVSLENGGVTGKVSNPYLPGTPIMQLRALQRAIGFEYVQDDYHSVLAVWPRNGARQQQVMRVAADSSMIGYPAFTQSGLILQTIYTNGLGLGVPIQVESDFAPASGKWVVAKLQHTLECNVPNGRWTTEIEASLFGQPPAIVD